MLSEEKKNSPTNFDESTKSKHWVFYALPVFVVAAICIFLLLGLGLNPRVIPSVLIGKAVPKFDLPSIKGRGIGLADTDLTGEISLINVFASWCLSCRAEHAVLMDFSRKNLAPIHGLNYKDDSNAANNWLTALGDPYKRVGADVDGKVGIEFGVYGVPETFLIAADGTIACKHIGPVRAEDIRHKIIPAILALRAKKDPAC